MSKKSKDKEKEKVAPKAPEGANADPKAPEGTNADPKAPEGANADPKAPEGANADPKAPEGANADPKAPEGTNADPKAPEGTNADPKAPDAPAKGKEPAPEGYVYVNSARYYVHPFQKIAIVPGRRTLLKVDGWVRSQLAIKIIWEVE